MLARNAIECLLKFPTRLLEGVPRVGQFRCEPANFGFRGQASSFEPVSLMLIVDLAFPRVFANGGQ